MGIWHQNKKQTKYRENVNSKMGMFGHQTHQKLSNEAVFNKKSFVLVQMQSTVKMGIRNVLGSIACESRRG